MLTVVLFTFPSCSSWNSSEKNYRVVSEKYWEYVENNLTWKTAKKAIELGKTRNMNFWLVI